MTSKTVRNQVVEPATENTAIKNVPRYSPRIGRIAIPEPRWDDEPLRCLKVNDDWVSHIIGVLNVLDQQDTWEGDDDQIRDARQQVNEIILAFMERCEMDCCLPPLTRMTPDGVLEVSYDGGVTWQDATTEDPRKSAPALPPVTDGEGDDKRCKAANRVIRQMKDAENEFKNNLGGGLTVLQLALAFAGAVAVLFLTAGSLAAVIVPALLTLAAAVVGTGAAAYDDLFTADVWSTLICKIYCHTESDGTYNQSDLLDILSDIDAAGFDPTVALTFTSILRGWQLEGLNNASRVITADNLSCDDCSCNGCIDNFDVNSGVGTIIDRTGLYIDVESVFYAPYGFQTASIKTADMDTCCFVSSYSVQTEGVSILDVHRKFCGSDEEIIGGVFSSGCVWLVTFILDGVGTVRVNFDDCP